MPTVELDIRQLADEGGTAPLAPITVTDAVLDEDGNTLTDTLDELKSGLTNVTNHYDVANVKIISALTNASTIGFRLVFNANTSFSILYFDLGRLAIVGHSSNSTPTVAEIHGTFENKYISGTEVYLRVGTWIRGTFILQGAVSDVTITTYS